MIGQTVVFDGHCFNDRFYVGEVNIGLPEFIPSIRERACGDGSEIDSMRMGAVEIEIQLIAKPVQGEPARQAMSDLLAWLHVDGPRRLSLSSDAGLWRMVVPNGTPTNGDSEWNDRIRVSFFQGDPALYGKLHSATVPSGGSVSFDTRGDYPTTLALTADAAVRDESTGLWGVRLDDGDYLRLSLGSGSHAVIADSGERTCTVDGAVTLPTPYSDWLELEAGAHTLANDLGTGACTVKWYERWHR